ncbi:hypothetical protein VTN31DRAFT_2302 [Thermomyces dupontii]|uniref:uncharacterized protein n=1 Tax=Talaromyces thermophilus TaxID=28565 RepID=UPI003744209F
MSGMISRVDSQLERSKGQHEILDASYTFSLDALPVQFSSYRVWGKVNDSGSANVDLEESQRSELNAAMRDLAGMIRRKADLVSNISQRII